eukprot:jgi/Undpi1/9709/HiC_scaffold_27.g12165.m1
MVMERYRRQMEAIERERINFLNKIDLIQPSFEEQHQLEWGRRYQEEELSSLRSELNKVSREVEAETKLLEDRENIIRGIREEQRQDRIKIQTLLALSQPITPDITVVFRSLAPNAPAPPRPPPTIRRRPSKSATRLRGGSFSPPRPRQLSQNSMTVRRGGADTTTPISASRHLRDIYLLERSYDETLVRDRQEREIQVKVQKENISVVAESLRRRTVEVDGRLAGATEDYLRLRHRAKEAHAVSAEEQAQCAEARRKSRAEVESTIAAASAEIDAVKRQGRIQLDESTVDLRKNLGVAEEALQRERSHHAAIKRRHEERVAKARKGVLLTRRRHHKLVRRRAEEVVHLSDEMSALRRGVTELERRMFAAW